MREPLQNLTEDEVINRLKGKITPAMCGHIGIGDDCAVVDNGILLKTDCIVEGRHYLPDSDPVLVGRKAIARVISDFAAMGGIPTSFLITIGVRGTTSYEYLEKIYEGMDAIAITHGARILGGETVSVPEGATQFFSVSGMGQAEKPILRSGAEIGDLIYVSGVLGNTLNSDHHLNFIPRVAEAQWLVENVSLTSMMDVSDGVARDLPRIAKSSDVGYTLSYENVPVRAGALLKGALTDGEDYELLFTVPANFQHQIENAPFPFYQIGTITKDIPIPLEGGWDHLG